MLTSSVPAFSNLSTRRGLAPTAGAGGSTLVWSDLGWWCTTFSILARKIALWLVRYLDVSSIYVEVSYADDPQDEEA